MMSSLKMQRVTLRATAYGARSVGQAMHVFSRTVSKLRFSEGERRLSSRWDGRSEADTCSDEWHAQFRRRPKFRPRYFFTIDAVAFEGSGPDGPSTTNVISFVETVLPTHEAPGRNNHTV